MTQQTASSPTPELRPEDIFEQRKAKIGEFAAAGLKPFGKRYDGTISTAEARALFVPGSEKPVHVKIAGRMTAFRAMGKAVFADVKDSSGRMQIYVQRDAVGEEFYRLFKKFDIGDIIGVEGELFQTKTGEITVKATSCTLLSKSLRPLPEKYHGLTDMEARYRQRYLDLIMNEDVKNTFIKRSQIIKEIRKLYESQVPIFAICLGHQLMALATGADTKKMKYGHRGGNHPVKDLETGRVYISSQNHGYVVDTETLDPKIAVPAFENVNDKTNEGLRYVGKNIFTVQFHPEACPGPQDSGYLFDRFIKMMEVTE